MGNINQIPMVDGNGQAGLVDADKLEGAKAAGFEPAIKMAGPDGSTGYVAESRVGAARAASYAVTPDNAGVQRMATPKGELTYALPSEVDQFKASGHVPIDEKGNFHVDPIAGEDNTDTMARAAAIAKNLPPEVLKKAMEAEKQTITPTRVGATLLAAPVIGAVGAGALAGAGEITPSVTTVARAAGTAAGTAVRLARTPVGKYLLKRGLEAAGAGAGYELVKKWLEK